MQNFATFSSVEILHYCWVIVLQNQSYITLEIEPRVQENKKRYRNIDHKDKFVAGSKWYRNMIENNLLLWQLSSLCSYTASILHEDIVPKSLFRFISEPEVMGMRIEDFAHPIHQSSFSDCANEWGTQNWVLVDCNVYFWSVRICWYLCFLCINLCFTLLFYILCCMLKDFCWKALCT